MTDSTLRALARDCAKLADRLAHRERLTVAHRRQVLAMLERCEHGFITALVDSVVAQARQGQPKPWRSS